MKFEFELDPMLRCQLIRLYKGMLNPGHKTLIHQKILDNGVMMIEWVSPRDVLHTVFLHPNENYRKT